jgi:uncharacterized protein (DUF58 family)
MSQAPVTPLFTDDVLARLRRVVLQSRRLARTGLTGEHRSLLKGPSPEFADFKAYTVGDDYRRIDWRVYARFDSLFVRESEITAEFEVHLLADVSRSMDWSGSPERPTKLRQALQLTGALGYLSLWHFDRLSITPVGSDAQRRFGPVQGRSHTRSMLAWLERLHAQREADLTDAMRRLVFERRRSGLLLVVSDFLSTDLAALERAMQGAIGRGWEVMLLQIFDPAEEDPALMTTLTQTHRARDLESGAQMPIRADDGALARYGQRRAAWVEDLERLGGGARSLHVPIPTSIPVDQAMIRLLRNVGMVA